MSLVNTMSLDIISARTLMRGPRSPIMRLYRTPYPQLETENMITLSLIPLSLSSPLKLQHSPSRPHLSDSIFRSKLSPITSRSPSFRNKTVVLGSNSSDPKSRFLDENGVVDDMDGYLNYLSLEYDSVWDTKPSWCQPWTITLTGILLITGSWLILHSVLVTAVVFSLICAWWYTFLYSYPKAYSDMIEERRKKVKNGVEDTFGLRQSQ